MAKTKGPLLSLDAHGSLSKLLTFSNKRTGQQVRKYNKPLTTPSAKQRGQRRLTEFLVAQWQNMSTAAKAVWETNAKASSRNLPGYQYFLREAQRDLYTYHGLCGYWHCNEIVAGHIKDISGNANHGQLKPSYPSNAPILVSSKDSKVSNALWYDGIDDYVEVPPSATLNIVGDISLEALIKVPTAGWRGHDEPLEKYRWDASDDQGGFNLQVNGGKIITFAIRANGEYNAEWSAPVDTWFWVVGTYNVTTQYLRIYANGEFKHQVIGPTSIPTHSAESLFFGQSSNALCFLDEVCIYNRALSAAEIATRYKFSQQEAG